MNINLCYYISTLFEVPKLKSRSLQHKSSSDCTYARRVEGKHTCTHLSRAAKPVTVYSKALKRHHVTITPGYRQMPATPRHYVAFYFFDVSWVFCRNLDTWRYILPIFSEVAVWDFAMFLHGLSLFLVWPVCIFAWHNAAGVDNAEESERNHHQCRIENIFVGLVQTDGRVEAMGVLDQTKDDTNADQPNDGVEDVE